MVLDRIRPLLWLEVLTLQGERAVSGGGDELGISGEPALAPGQGAASRIQGVERDPGDGKAPWRSWSLARRADHRSPSPAATSGSATSGAGSSDRKIRVTMGGLCTPKRVGT